MDWRPRPVAALAATGDGSLAAALREDGDVELYDTSTFACIQVWHARGWSGNRQVWCFENWAPRGAQPGASPPRPLCLPASLQRVPGSASACATCLAIVEEEEDAQHRSLRPRLFTGGLDGTITELSLETLAPAAAVDSHGGAVWALALQPGGPVAPGEPRRLAAACDDGSVRLFSVEHGGGSGTTTFARALPRVEGRMLCLAWHPNGDALACAGSDGCIHVWSTSSGRELLRVDAAETDGPATPEPCVWDVLVLPDGTLVSADSSGAVAFWDGAHGTLLARFRQHRADALRLAASPDGNTVFSAGVDGQLAVYRRLRAGTPAGAAAVAAEQQRRQVQRQGQAGAVAAPLPARPASPWAYLSAKRCHSHDVRALAVVSGRHAPQPRLLSGGNDTQVLAHSVARFLNVSCSRVGRAPVPRCTAS